MTMMLSIATCSLRRWLITEGVDGSNIASHSLSMSEVLLIPVVGLEPCLSLLRPTATTYKAVRGVTDKSDQRFYGDSAGNSQ
jgi:hypothetical protein